MTKSAFFTFAHEITRCKNIAYFGSYRAAFAHVVRELDALGYRNAKPGFQIIEPKRLWA